MHVRARLMVNQSNNSFYESIRMNQRKSKKHYLRGQGGVRLGYIYIECLCPFRSVGERERERKRIKEEEQLNKNGKDDSYVHLLKKARFAHVGPKLQTLFYILITL